MKKSLYILFFLLIFISNVYSFSNIITDITFSGNSVWSDEQLDIYIKSKIGNVFDSEIVQNDINRIYKTGFFTDVGADTEYLDGGVKLIFKVIENAVIRNISIDGNRTISDSIIKKVMTLSEGRVFNFNSLRKDITEIENLYKSRGFVMTKVVDVSVDKDGENIDIKLVEPVIQNILVKGNTQTETDIILKKLNIKTGDNYNFIELNRGIERLREMDMFENIRFFINSGEDKRFIIVEIVVEEKKTGELDFGINYGKYNGFTGTISLLKKNFRGKGESVEIESEFGEVTNYEVKWNFPYTFNKNIATEFSFFDYSMDKEKFDSFGNKQYDFKEKRKGIKINFKGSDHASPYNYEYINESITIDNPVYVKDNKDWLTVSRKYKNDNGYTNIKIGVTGKGFLDGNTGYYNWDFEKCFFVTKKSGEIAFRLKTENLLEIENALVEYEKVAVGGSDSLRGYKARTFTSDKYILLNIEKRNTLNEKFDYILFSDIADIENDIKTTAGIGFAFKSAIGIIRVDYGRPINDENNKKGRIYLGLGYMF